MLDDLGFRSFWLSLRGLGFFDLWYLRGLGFCCLACSSPSEWNKIRTATFVSNRAEPEVECYYRGLYSQNRALGPILL